MTFFASFKKCDKWSAHVDKETQHPGWTFWFLLCKKQEEMNSHKTVWFYE